ncbi:cytochrome P450 4V2 [Ixodes scapularis]
MSAIVLDKLFRQSLSSSGALLLACAVVIAAAYVCVRCVAQWIRMYYYLRKVPHPQERWPFSMVFDLWNSVSKMDRKLHLTARLHKYFDTLIPSIHDQDVTVAFYGPQPFLLAVTPTAMEAVLSSTSNLNKSFIYRMMTPWMGNGILTSDKDVWRTRRKILTPAFHFRILEDYTPIINRRTTELLQKLRKMEGEFFDMLPVLRMAAFGMLFETAMGVQIDEAEVERRGLLRVTDELAASVIGRIINIFHWPDFVFNLTKKGQRFYNNVEYIRSYNEQIVKKRKAEYKVGLEDSNKRKSFLDILLRMHLEDGTLTEDQVRDEVATVFIGGFDTTATAASYTLYLLGHYPEIQAKVHRELDEVFGDDWDRPVTLEDMKNLKYLECVIKESMRLYPPVPVVARNIDEDMKVGEFTIPRGTVAFAVIFALHRHPRVYENPNDFIPERFLEKKERHPYAYVPFSGGSRNCIGQRFAQIEDKIMLAQILRRFKVESKVPIEELQLQIEIVLRPVEGIELKLTKRERSA